MTALIVWSGAVAESQEMRHRLAVALGWTLLHFCWQGAAVAAVLGCVLAMLGPRRPQARYMAACGALILMVALPLATFARLADAALNRHRVVEHAALDFEETAAPDATVGLSHAALRARVEMTLKRSVLWLPAIWFAGVALFLLRLAFGLLFARRLRSTTTVLAEGELHAVFRRLTQRMKVRRAVALLQSARVQAPTVVGWLRPVVLLPVSCFTGLSPQQIEALLAHELAHIRRHDYLVSVAQSVVEALLFYHPAVWWVSRQARRERECCCDQVAAAVCGDALEYARALSQLEERRSRGAEVVMAANGGVLTMRIKRILGYKESPAVSPLAVAALSAALMASLGLYFAGTAHAQPGAAANGASAQAETGGVPSQIEVDQSCHILTVDLRDPAHPGQRRRYDPGICHTESDHVSQHWESTIANGTTRRSLVTIREHEFLLHNPYPQPIVFLVHQSMPRHYQIDSNPAPEEVSNSVATFHVQAEANVTVRFHVGMRSEPVPQVQASVPVSSVSVSDEGGPAPGTKPGQTMADGATAPQLIHSAEPEYTEEARKAKLSGTVLVAMRVGTNGLPSDVHVVKRLGHGLDAKAVEAVKQYRFSPATKDGEAVAEPLKVEINFQIF